MKAVDGAVDRALATPRLRLEPLRVNPPSEHVAKRLGLAPTDRIEDGERVWSGVLGG